KLQPFFGEELDAVVFEGVVRGGNHDAGVDPQASREKGDRRGGKRTDQKNVDPHRADPGGQGRFQHISRNPGIFADDDPVPPRFVLENMRGGAAKLHRHLTGHRIDIGNTPNAIGSKKFTHETLYLVEETGISAVLPCPPGESSCCEACWRRSLLIFIFAFPLSRSISELIITPRSPWSWAAVN